MPDSFIGVDVIVGTRGETEEYFGQAYEFIKSLDVTQLHVFSYSERPGTQALKIDHVVAPEEKHRRSQQLLELRTKDPCFLCAPYRADDAGVAGTSQTRTADARLHSQLYPCGSPS